MPGHRDNDECEDMEHNESATAKIEGLGRDSMETLGNITALGTSLLHGMSGALDGLVEDLTNDPSSSRRSQIHPWERSSRPETEKNTGVSNDSEDDSNEYDENYDRIH